MRGLAAWTLARRAAGAARRTLTLTLSLCQALRACEGEGNAFFTEAQ
ncbi:MAG: hypothetical protein IJM64_07430 [Ottowia sp.]|nr:hypothetical protein [Ottowia sp.]